MTGIGKVAAELRSIALEATDATGYFAALYASFTARVAASVEEKKFDDPERMERFAVAFANLYVKAFRREIPRPSCWQASWNVVENSELLILQHLLLGINAHVNHDLPQAVVAVAGDGDLEPIRDDFNTINDLLADTNQSVIDNLDRVSRWANEAAGLGGGRAFNFSLRVARGQAWGAAGRIHALEGEARKAYIAELDRLVTVLAFLVTQPLAPVRPLVWLARRLEENDPRKVTAALLGTS